MVSFLRGNLIWILLSVVLSTALWLVVTFQQNPEKIAVIPSVPVTVQGAPKDYVVQSEVQTVDLEVSAPSDVWPQLQADRFRVTVDASKVTTGVNNYPLTVVSLDPRARVENLDPASISLRVEPFQTKKVPVQVVVKGSVPFSYNAGTAQVTPSDVTVSGPQSSVGQVTSAVVDVNLEGATKNIDQTITPSPETASGASVDRIQIDPQQVVVSVPIEQQLAYKTLPVQLTLTGHVAVGYQINGAIVDPVAVTLVGDPKTLNQLEFITTQPVNVDGATGDREVQVNLALPGTVALYQAQTVVAHVFVSAMQGTATVPVKPKIVNDAKGVTYSITPGTINVTLTGPIPAISGLGPDDVSATIDVKGMTNGTQNLPVTVKVPGTVSESGVQPNTVSVSAKPPPATPTSTPSGP